MVGGSQRVHTWNGCRVSQTLSRVPLSLCLISLHMVTAVVSVLKGQNGRPGK